LFSIVAASPAILFLPQKLHRTSKVHTITITTTTTTATTTAMPSLATARYGKDNVRVYKVHRNQETGVQTVTEMTVCCLLEGAIETS